MTPDGNVSVLLRVRGSLKQITNTKFPPQNPGIISGPNIQHCFEFKKIYGRGAQDMKSIGVQCIFPLRAQIIQI